jgi:ubiquinone/menaquinone biosynthesis C-methylase UbiE
VLERGAGLRCSVTGRVFPYHKGILDLLPAQGKRTFTQRTLDTTFTSWFYDRFRNQLTRLLWLPSFPNEVKTIGERLQLEAGDIILDLACGPGNFTLEWAERVGASGLVLGVDLSLPMLERAAAHIESRSLTNVLLIRADAQHLPFADQSIRKLNCSGGFHQFPDLPQALREIGRVTCEGALLTASTFAEGPNDRYAFLKRWLRCGFSLHFVSLPWLGEALRSMGYVDYEWSLPGGWFGYTSAVRRSTK